jgi:uncharacterized membrane protein
MKPGDGAAGERQTGRLEAFSDGVFAIAITLLVLELKVPSFDRGRASAEALRVGLAAEWPAYLAFVTSFFTILVMWVHHHIVFRQVYRADNLLLWVNGFLLLLVSAVPFPTAVVAEYLNTPAAGVASAFYAGVFVFIGVAFLLLLAAAFRDPLIARNSSVATRRRLWRSYWFGPPGYLLAVGAAFIGPLLAMGICTAMYILWAATTRECADEEGS